MQRPLIYDYFRLILTITNNLYNLMKLKREYILRVEKEKVGGGGGELRGYGYGRVWR